MMRECLKVVFISEAVHTHTGSSWCIFCNVRVNLIRDFIVEPRFKLRLCFVIIDRLILTR